MYDIVKNVIQSGRYELSDMLIKVDTLWLQGDLTEDQRGELVELSRQNADPANSYAPLQKQIDTLYLNVAELAERVLALEGGAVEPEEWPEYVQPTGNHDAYNTGDKVTYKGRHYICKQDGCVWSPDDYPDAWEEDR